MKLLKISLSLCLIIQGISISKAQEISVLSNIGFQGLNFTVSKGLNEIKIGGRVGVGYTYFIDNHFGIVTGAEVGIYRNSSTLEDQLFTSYEVDSENDAFEYRIKTTGYEEQSHFYAGSIPLMFQYRTAGETQFYINGGCRIYIPFSQKTTITVKELKMSGYYADTNVVLEDMSNFGFVTLKNWKGETEPKLDIGFGISGEMGLSFNFSDRVRLYTGIYVDYGLNEMRKSNLGLDKPLINYNDKEYNKNAANGILETSTLVDKANLLGYGIQLRLGFGEYRSRNCFCSK